MKRALLQRKLLDEELKHVMESNWKFKVIVRFVVFSDLYRTM